MVKVGVGQKTVEVVDDMSTVHDLSEDVLQVLPRDFATAGILQIVVEATSAVAQVSQAERIHHVETHRTFTTRQVSVSTRKRQASRRQNPLTEEFPLHHEGVEVTEAKQNALGLAIGIINVGLREVGPGTLDVSLETCQRGYTSVNRQGLSALRAFTYQPAVRS
jgi:hypothetical protein